jgi:hypothetical protein
MNLILDYILSFLGISLTKLIVYSLIALSLISISTYYYFDYKSLQKKEFNNAITINSLYNDIKDIKADNEASIQFYKGKLEQAKYNQTTIIKYKEIEKKDVEELTTKINQTETLKDFFQVLREDI